MRAGFVVYAVDLERMSSFYAAVANLDEVTSADDHRVLAADHLEIVVVRSGVAVEVSRPPRVREETPIKPVLPVADLAAARVLAAAHGGRVLPVDREWVFGAHRVCDGVDPEGNVVQLRSRTI
jgi:predicted enzyme related to lactoylglutathione lyase